MNDAGFEEASDAFMSWLSSQPGVIISSKLSLHDYSEENSGRGVIATQDIAEDEVLFSIPRASLLSWQNSTLRQHLSEDEVAGLGDWNTLILTMLYENGLPSSRWAPYFQILPGSFTTPMFWSESETAELQGSTLASKIGREDADKCYHETIAPLIQRHSDLFDLARCTLEAFHRMGSLIMAYSFDAPLQGRDSAEDNDDSSDDEDEEEEEEVEKVMCPLSDLLNADTHLNNARLFYESEALVMKSTQAIRNGDQIYNTYGELPNSDLLRRYGYVQTENQSNVVEILGDLVTSVFPMSEQEKEARVDWLLDMEILDDAFEIGESGKVPKEVLVTMEFMALTYLDFCRVRDSGDSMPKGTKTQEIQTRILKLLKTRIEQYATDVSSDEALLQQTEMPYNLRNAVVVRLDEKRILHKALQTVSDWSVVVDSQPSKKRSGDTQQSSGKKTRVK